ncbi:MAG TPA: hypothetical protein DCR93_00570, partial [Cytophagales bacterium]|nr:hypothetical protein [Cytophagales bacterium]
AITEEAPLDKLLTKQGKAHEGFHADAGLGCFMDAATHRRYLKQVDDWYWEQPKGANYFQQVLAGEFETYSGSHPYSHAYGDWNNHVVDVTQGLNVMMFSTGWGHGYYPAYWGYADGEEAVELTIDFQI